GEAGAAVAVTGRRDEWLSSAEHTLKEHRIDALAIRGDVSEPADVASTVAAVLDRFNRVDVLVNSAGISWGAPAETMALEKWRVVMDTNVTGCFLTAQAIGVEMIRAGRGGTIVNVASISGLVGTAPDVLDAVGYSASKGAVVSLTRDLAVKWARHRIRVNAIAPGFFETRLTRGVLARSQPDIERSIPMGRIGKPGELKGAALFLASPAAEYITGHVLTVDGGATAW